MYSTQSGGCSRHTAHSLDELSSDSVFGDTLCDDPALRGSPVGGGTGVRGVVGVGEVEGTLRRGMVATAWVGGAGNEVSNDDGIAACGSAGS